jgi:hypothetical protein
MNGGGVTCRCNQLFRSKRKPSTGVRTNVRHDVRFLSSKISPLTCTRALCEAHTSQTANPAVTISVVRCTGSAPKKRLI